jgi:hypothetical protein
MDSSGKINANRNGGANETFISTPANDITGFSLHKTVSFGKLMGQ